MSDETPDSDRRTLLQLAALAGLPLAAGSANADRTDDDGTSSAASASGDHLGETWSGDPSSGHGLKLDVTGSNNGFEAVTSEGKAISATTTSTTGGIGVYADTASTSGEGVWAIARADTGDTKGVQGESWSSEGRGVFGWAYNSSGTNYGVYGKTDSPDGYGVYSDGDLHVEGDFTASGTKNFVQTVDTPEGPKNVAYTAVEADRAQTETTGVAELSDGEAEIDLPEHFGLVTSSDEDLVVQLTPYDVDAPRLAVTERSTDRVVVESADSSGDCEFSYTVRGVREGYEDAEVVRDE